LKAKLALTKNNPIKHKIKKENPPKYMVEFNVLTGGNKFKTNTTSNKNIAFICVNFTFFKTSSKKQKVMPTINKLTQIKP
ncbi:MAG: hypothetical protein RR454_04120, partial [Clostridia bacterium]